MNADELDWQISKDEPKIIKVIGVGGGGGNAVTHMYRKGIQDVSFLLCNTDVQALQCSEVPDKLAIGRLGAGGIPERAKEAAEKYETEIRQRLSDGTEMVLITAGMGGGTGTGAAPIIARIAKEMEILTVGIVTIPFLFERNHKILQALDGVEQIEKNVDALLVINNERLRKIYPDLSLSNAFAKADDTLAIAAKSIAEIITVPGKINLDFADVHSTLTDGGVALISNGYGEGDRRLELAINDALNSPLINNTNIYAAKKILFSLSFSEESPLLMEEMDEVDKFMSKFNRNVNVIWGTTVDDSLGYKVKITILASGFGVKDMLPEMLEDKTGRDEVRIEEVYGDMLEPSNKPTFAILTIEELDDDELIEWLEDTPACRRDLKKIKERRNKKQAFTAPIPAAKPASSSATSVSY